MPNKLGKDLRIKNPKEFSRIFSKNKSFHKPGVIMLTKQNELNQPRLGITLPKKHIKLSVKRNKIKRIIKESFRLNCKNIKNSDIVILSQRKLNSMSKHNIQETLKELWINLKN